jgi:hypothetical protein
MKYLYEGPNSGVTLQDGTEVLLWNGKEVELPADNEYVKTLMALGYLKTLQETKKTKKEVNENAS